MAVLERHVKKFSISEIRVGILNDFFADFQRLVVAYPITQFIFRILALWFQIFDVQIDLLQP